MDSILFIVISAMSGHTTYDPKSLHLGMLQNTFVVLIPIGLHSPCTYFT